MKLSQKKLENIYSRMTPEQRVQSVYEDIKRDVFESNEHEPLPPSEHGNYCLIETDIKRIKVATFIKIVVHGDYSGIIYQNEYSEDPTDEQKEAALDAIMLQGSDIMQDNSLHLKQSATQQRLAFKINTVTNIINALLIAGYYEPLIAELKEWGYNYPFTEDSLAKDLERVKTALIRDRITKDRAGRELLEMQGKASNEKPTEKAIYDTLAEIRKFENYPDEVIVLADKLSLHGYFTSTRRYKTHIEHLKKQAA